MDNKTNVRLRHVSETHHLHPSVVYARLQYKHQRKNGIFVHSSRWAAGGRSSLWVLIIEIGIWHYAIMTRGRTTCRLHMMPGEWICTAGVLLQMRKKGGNPRWETTFRKNALRKRNAAEARPNNGNRGHQERNTRNLKPQRIKNKWTGIHLEARERRGKEGKLQK